MAKDRFGFESLLRNKRAIKALREARDMKELGRSTAEIKRYLREEYVGAPWLDLLIQFLPVLLKLLEKLLNI